MTAAAPCARRVVLGPVELLPPGEGRSFRVEGHRVAVFRQRDGSLFAVQNECPHRAGPLSEGIIGSCAVICPLHSWKFDLASGACLTEPSHRLRTYPVEERGGEMVLTLTETDTGCRR